VKRRETTAAAAKADPHSLLQKTTLVIHEVKTGITEGFKLFDARSGEKIGRRSIRMLGNYWKKRGVEERGIFGANET